MAPAQQADETIRSADSSLYAQPDTAIRQVKQTNRVQAYVDFSEYNRNYEAYMRKHKLDLNDNRPISVIMKEQEEKAKAKLQKDRESASK